MPNRQKKGGLGWSLAAKIVTSPEFQQMTRKKPKPKPSVKDVTLGILKSPITSKYEKPSAGQAASTLFSII
jgi:hypothetical protein